MFFSVQYIDEVLTGSSAGSGLCLKEEKEEVLDHRNMLEDYIVAREMIIFLLRRVTELLHS